MTERPEDDRSAVSKAVVTNPRTPQLQPIQLTPPQATALIPLRSAISKPAQKAYLSTFLFAFASLALFAISTVAYTLFYYNYVPQVGVERVIHLQFGCACFSPPPPSPGRSCVFVRLTEAKLGV